MAFNSLSFSSIDLFAGVGGIRLGFEFAFNSNPESRSRISTSYVCELDKFARATYSQNFNLSVDSPIFGKDVSTAIVKSSIPDFDICLAGFPCQAFSLAGKRKGFNDEKRGKLFFDVEEICRKHTPKIIFCENVRGLYTLGKKEKGKKYHSGYEIIRTALQNLGYKVFEKILNSANFGVPQHRERLYIVAIRNDLIKESEEFIFPEDNAEAVISKKWAATCMEQIRQEGPIPSHYYLSRRYYETLKRHRIIQKEKGRGFGFVVRNWSGISGTILCSNMGRERNLVVDKRHGPLIPKKSDNPYNDEHVRKLTPREYMRLQGFPEDFKVEGISDAQLYKQFGNSVTIPVIESIAVRIREFLEKNAS